MAKISELSCETHSFRISGSSSPQCKARVSQNGKFDKSSTDKWYTGLESDVAIKMQNWRCAQGKTTTHRDCYKNCIPGISMRARRTRTESTKRRRGRDEVAGVSRAERQIRDALDSNRCSNRDLQRGWERRKATDPWTSNREREVKRGSADDDDNDDETAVVAVAVAATREPRGEEPGIRAQSTHNKHERVVRSTIQPVSQSVSQPASQSISQSVSHSSEL